MNQPNSPSNQAIAAPVAKLIQQFNKMPGIGPKLAQRLAFWLIRMPKEESISLAEAISSVKEQTTFCNKCQNITEEDPCPICRDSYRDQARICIVQDPLDVLALEKTGAFKGTYHVLHGVLDPMSNIGPDDLRIKELLERINSTNITELVLATNPNVEGEATAMYIQQLASPFVEKITILARGLPVGGDLEYADDLTLTRAFEGRQEL